jgi:methionyl-tRNA synthetase
VSGSDENSLKNVRAAQEAGVPTARHVAANAERFLELNGLLQASLDGFVRTSVDLEHTRTATWLFQRCRERGDIYKRAYRGLYCVGCEQFYKESELVQGLCPEHARAPELVEEENYFFRLSRYAPQLRALIESGELEIAPDERRNEVLRFIADGLSDFSVSRSRARSTRSTCGVRWAR